MAEQHAAAAAVNKSLLSIDYVSKYCFVSERISLFNCIAENLDTDDYLKEGDKGFKKVKVRFRLSGVVSESYHGYRARRNASLEGHQPKPN